MTAPTSLPLAGRVVRRLPVVVTLTAHRDWRLRRRMRAQIARLPAYLLQDVGLIDQAPPEANGNRMLDHNLRGGPHW
ncbi:DUF1127 domain-containing protein [Paracoccus sp. S-4012]|uniref:DUF1127 domain-containing protein n=1 Tax=Paracoccus sp. S-4012 TaxID=2665648 RepID=UPI0012AEEF96|nr:DUF1127 domain-containing protein [Paracoccus sp. S-4012]MRX51015.1 DUF1127 domain-containing protein [Paracoccus sp. S-4012]